MLTSLGMKGHTKKKVLTTMMNHRNSAEPSSLSTWDPYRTLIWSIIGYMRWTNKKTRLTTKGNDKPWVKKAKGMRHTLSMSIRFIIVGSYLEFVDNFVPDEIGNGEVSSCHANANHHCKGNKPSRHDRNAFKGIHQRGCIRHCWWKVTKQNGMLFTSPQETPHNLTFSATKQRSLRLARRWQTFRSL